MAEVGYIMAMLNTSPSSLPRCFRVEVWSAWSFDEDGRMSAPVTAGWQEYGRYAIRSVAEDVRRRLVLRGDSARVTFAHS